MAVGRFLMWQLADSYYLRLGPIPLIRKSLYTSFPCVLLRKRLWCYALQNQWRLFTLLPICQATVHGTCLMVCLAATWRSCQGCLQYNQRGWCDSSWLTMPAYIARQHVLHLSAIRRRASFFLTWRNIGSSSQRGYPNVGTTSLKIVYASIEFFINFHQN